MKKSLEGLSTQYFSYGLIYVKTLSGKILEIQTKMNNFVKTIKEIIDNM